MNKNLQYTGPKERRCRRLAAGTEFGTEDGGTDFGRIAQAVGIHRDAAVFILTGELPEGMKKAAPKKSSKAAAPAS